MNRESKVVIVGITGNSTQSNSVELLKISDGTWTPLQPMRKHRRGYSVALYNDQIIVVGGSGKSMETSSLNALHTDLFITWKHFPAELPVSLAGHSSVVYKGRLIVIGGFDTDKNECSNRITEISLVPPYTSKLLATMPQESTDHGVVLFGDKIVIVGGGNDFATALEKVVMYDITRNEFQELAPLPYPVYEMATVKWRDDHIIIIGGTDNEDEPLSKVLIYNIKTQKSHLLPDMKCERRDCAAAVIRRHCDRHGRQRWKWRSLEVGGKFYIRSLYMGRAARNERREMGSHCCCLLVIYIKPVSIRRSCRE